LEVQPSPEVILLPSTNGVLSCFLLLFQSLPAEKKNGPVLCLYLEDICLWTLDNLGLLALLSSVSDNDPISYRKACHELLPGAGYLLLISHSGPPQEVPAFFVNLLTIPHDFFGSDDALPTNPGPEGRPSGQNGLVASATTKTAPALAARVSTLAAATIFSWSSFVDGESTPVDLLAVQGGNSRLSFLTVAHLDKAEAFRAARVPVHDDLSRLNRSVRLEQVLQINVGHAIRQVADVQFLSHDGPPSENITQDKLDPQRADAVA